MDNSVDSCDIVDRDGDAAATSSSSICAGVGAGGFKLLNRHGTVHQFMGGGRSKILTVKKNLIFPVKINQNEIFLISRMENYVLHFFFVLFVLFLDDCVTKFWLFNYA